MSPIVHGMIAWLVAVLFAKRINDRRFITVAGVVPDIDGIFILLSNSSYSEFHHTFGHSFVFGILVAVTVYALSTDRVKAFFGALTAFSLHLAADIVGTNWSVPIFYPVSDFSMTAGLDHFQIFTIISVVFFVSLALIIILMFRKGISPIEFISERLDRYLVEKVFPMRIEKNKG